MKPKLSATLLLSLWMVSMQSIAQDGSHDLSFNGTGYTLFPGFSGNVLFRDVCVLPGGRLLALGNFNYEYTAFVALFRYHPDGSLDSSWNSTGYLMDTLGRRRLHARALGVQANGRILVGGYSSDLIASPCYNMFNISAFSDPGRQDSTWGLNSRRFIPSDADESQIEDMVVMSDDRVVAAGSFQLGADWKWQLARLNADGSLDPSFGYGGVALLDLGTGMECALGLMVEPDGKLVTVGFSSNSGHEDAVIARFNPDGSPDLGFGSGTGHTTIPLSTSQDRLTGICRMDNGKYFAVGTSAAFGETSKRLYARFLPDGTLDNSYSGDGIDIDHLLSLPSSITNACKVIATSPSKVVVSGWYANSVIGDGYVQRLDSNGLPDLTFGTGGFDTLDVAGGYGNLFNNIVQQPDGKLVCSGSAQIPGAFTYFYQLARYSMDGLVAASSPLKTAVMAFPNPASTLLQVESPAPISLLVLMDAQGRPVISRRQPGSACSIDVSSLPSGTYHLLLIGNQGQMQAIPVLVQH